MGDFHYFGWLGFGGFDDFGDFGLVYNFGGVNGLNDFGFGVVSGVFGIFGGHSVTCFPYSEAVQDWDGCLSYVNGFLWALLALIRYFKPKICWNGNLINGDRCLMHFFESLRLCDQWAECCSLPKASEYAEGFFAFVLCTQEMKYSRLCWHSG